MSIKEIITVFCIGTIATFLSLLFIKPEIKPEEKQFNDKRIYVYENITILSDQEFEIPKDDWASLGKCEVFVKTSIIENKKIERVEENYRIIIGEDNE